MDLVNNVPQQMLLLKFDLLLKTQVGIIALSLLLFASGCKDSASTAPSQKLIDSSSLGTSDASKPRQIVAQGRIQPARGTLRITALPGDRVEQIMVKPGSAVKKGDRLVVMQSVQLRSMEFEAAVLKLDEARSALQVKRDESQLSITSAKLKVESAERMLEQAIAQKQLVQRGNDQVSSLRKQIDLLDQLRRSPLTRAAIGTLEFETKKNELVKVVALNDQSALTANQAVEMGKLQVAQAQKGLEVATQASQLVDRASPIASLEKQIELLQLQIEQAKMESPIDGVILSVNAEPGERVAQLPLVELANLTEMVCVAEVHEADVGRVSIGDSVELSSSSLARKLHGKVMRIDRVVGAVQLRFPNPMARSDFRAVPVWIAIDAADASLAANRLQLQVEVTITATTNTNP